MQNRRNLYNNFKQEISSFDLEKFKVNYKNMVTDDEVIMVIDEIVNYSIPKFKITIDEGKEIYEFIDTEVCLEPVGILPLYQKEGYILINSNNKNVLVFEYEIKLFERNDEKYRSISTKYLTNYMQTIYNTDENIKIQLIRSYKKLPNPATFSVSTKYSYPVKETLLQIAKRKLATSINI